ncbi:MAG: pitrilysin family protein [Clostridium sp.]|uniref:M16 family metallopeptidase n=1 Tax=Clostridium sp. TaxID=1506 RepID=UPI002FC6E1C7
MKKYILDNGIRLIYKRVTSSLTSVCVSLDGGALRDGEKLGIAHVTEHMVYKGTKRRSEEDINREISEVFGFSNAMTNYPYVIYYGTLLGEDLNKGMDILSDIIINPTFKEDGFKEEMDVIFEELKEWDEELEQYVEDKLFLNSFNKRRIKYPIIGTVQSLKSIKLDDVREFYNKIYFPRNTVITVITPLDFNEVLNITENYFGNWNIEKNSLKSMEYEEVKESKFIETKYGIKTSKVEIAYDISNLTNIEIKALRIFNEYFGEGVNSKLFDILRTKNGLVYDVLTRVSHENGIKLYKITFSTSKEKVEEALNLTFKCIDNISNLKTLYDVNIIKLKKSFKLRRLFKEEQSIVLAKELSTYETMFDDYKVYVDESESLDNINLELICNTYKKVFKNSLVQVIK